MSKKEQGPQLDVASALEWLAALEPKSAACAIFDPPFPGMERHVSRGTTTRLIGKGWFDSVSYEYIIDMFAVLWGAIGMSPSGSRSMPSSLSPCMAS